MSAKRDDPRADPLFALAPDDHFARGLTSNESEIVSGTQGQRTWEAGASYDVTHYLRAVAKRFGSPTAPCDRLVPAVRRGHGEQIWRALPDLLHGAANPTDGPPAAGPQIPAPETNSLRPAHRRPGRARHARTRFDQLCALARLVAAGQLPRGELQELAPRLL